jgi:restriction endonuclease Mrr
MRHGNGRYITYRSRRQRRAEDIFNEEREIRENQPEAEQEKVMGDNNEDIAIQILEGLATGQQQLAQLLA